MKFVLLVLLLTGAVPSIFAGPLPHGSWVDEAVRTVEKELQHGKAAVEGAVKEVTNDVQKGYKFVAEEVDASMNEVRKSASKVDTAVKGIVNEVTNDVQKSYKFVEKNLDATIDEVKMAASEVETAVKGAVKKVTKSIREDVKDVKQAAEKVENVAATVWKKVTGTFTYCYDGVARAVTSAWDSVFTAAKSIYEVLARFQQELMWIAEIIIAFMAMYFVLTLRAKFLSFINDVADLKEEDKAMEHHELVLLPTGIPPFHGPPAFVNGRVQGQSY